MSGAFMTAVLSCRIAAAAGFTLAIAAVAAAQGVYPGPPPGSGPGVSPVCGRLEAQLAAIDRGSGADPARADQARRIEDTLSRQQAELERTQAQWQRLACQPPGLFSIFSNQSPQCGPLGSQIQQMRANIDRTMSDLQRTRHGGDDEMQRQSVLGALAQNSCGPQYRAAAPQPRGFFETLFGIPSGGGGGYGNAVPPASGDYPQVGGSGYRTLCVRTCDGYYFPISYSTSASHFAEDEATCQKQCPATEAILFSHRNPGEDVSQAVAGNGRVYRDLPNAFRYRREFNPSCSCRAPGQSWADALGQTRDSTIGRGDIIINEERSKALGQPRDPQGRSPPAQPRSDTRKNTAPAPAPAADGSDPSAATGETDPSKRPVRSVGPTFISPR
jgi:hypothetical protein